MKTLLAFWAIVCGALLVFGGLIASDSDRMRLTVQAKPRLVTVVIVLPDLDERYRWLSVHGCSAEIAESGAFCTGDFERESSMEIGGRMQYLLDWRDLPSGTMQVTAMAFDSNRQVLASATAVVFRGR